jgi:DNA-binding MarR family transcriptional regulator
MWGRKVPEEDEIISNIENQVLLIRNSIDRTRPDSWIDLNLTMSQLKGLMYIEFKTNVCIKELAEALKIAQPNATKLADVLIRERLVSRKENTHDRRLLVLNTTAKGKKLLTTLRHSYSGELADYLKQLSSQELRILYQGLASLVNLIKEQGNIEVYHG